MFFLNCCFFYFANTFSPALLLFNRWLLCLNYSGDRFDGAGVGVKLNLKIFRRQAGNGSKLIDEHPGIGQGAILFFNGYVAMFRNSVKDSPLNFFPASCRVHGKNAHLAGDVTSFDGHGYPLGIRCGVFLYTPVF